MAKIIKLAGQDMHMLPPPFGKLRQVIDAINSMEKIAQGSDGFSPEAMEKIGLILAIMTGKTVEEIDNMPIGIDEMTAAMDLVPEVCGIVSKRVEPGKAAE